jgi:hypothetical protein
LSFSIPETSIILEIIHLCILYVNLNDASRLRKAAPQYIIVKKDSQMSVFAQTLNSAELVSLQIKWLRISRQSLGKGVPFVKFYQRIVETLPKNHPERTSFAEAVEIARGDVDEGNDSVRILKHTGIFDDHVMDILGYLTLDCYDNLLDAIDTALSYLDSITPFAFTHEENSFNGLRSPLRYGGKTLAEHREAVQI